MSKQVTPFAWGCNVKVKMCDLLSVINPRTRVRLTIVYPNDSFVYEASLSDFLKSQYYRIFWDALVEFNISGAISAFILDITVKGGLENDI